MTNKPIGYRKIFALTIPASLSVLIEPLAGMVDTAFVGHLSSDWLAALALCTSIVTSFMWVFNFLVFGLSASVAQALGAQDLPQVGREIRMGLLVSLVVGIVATIVTLLIKDFLLIAVMDARGEVLVASEQYYAIRVLGLVFAIGLSAITGALRGLQKIKESLYILGLVTIINIVATYLCLYVFELGLKGAAYGTVFSYVAGYVSGLFYLYRHRVSFGLSEPFTISKQHFLTMGKEAWDIFGRTGTLVFSLFLATTVASRIGSLQVAAHQVLMQYWLLVSFVVDGLAITATAVGGNLIGAKQFYDYKRVGYRLVKAGGLFGLAFSLIFFLFSGLLPQIFTQDPSVLVVVASVWWLIVITQPMNALIFVYDGLLFATKDFQFLRRRMQEGFLLLYCPILIWAYVHQSLGAIWVALSGLYLYRFISSSIFFARKTA